MKLPEMPVQSAECTFFTPNKISPVEATIVRKRSLTGLIYKSDERKLRNKTFYLSIAEKVTDKVQVVTLKQ